MATFPEAEARLFKNVYICRKCEGKSRLSIGRVLAGKGVCSKCGAKQLRGVRKRSKN